MREPAQERISRENLLLGYTIYNARSLGDDDRIGSLEAGKRANLCILSDNLFEVPAEKIHEIKPERVMFEGKFVR